MPLLEAIRGTFAGVADVKYTMIYVTTIPAGKWKHARTVFPQTPPECPYIVARSETAIWGVFPRWISNLQVELYIAPIQRPNTRSSAQLYIPTPKETLEMVEVVRNTMDAL